MITVGSDPELRLGMAQRHQQDVGTGLADPVEDLAVRHPFERCKWRLERAGDEDLRMEPSQFLGCRISNTVGASE